MIKRNKFDLYDLANEILDHLPRSVFHSSETKFLDPAMGGGQFCYAIENRLREYGHSDENISQRVFGFESVIMDIRFAVNKYKLVGQYSCVKPMTFLKTETLDMKFDVIVGNPPYQSGKGNGSHPIYRQFIERSMELLNEDGCLAMLSPPGFLNTTKIGTATDLFQTFKDGDLVKVQLERVNDYFPGIGSPICYVVWQNKPYSGKTTINNDEIDISELTYIPRIFDANIHSILKKISGGSDTVDTEYRKFEGENKHRVVFKELNHISNKRGNIKAKIMKPGESHQGFNFAKVCKNKAEAVHLCDYLNSDIASFFNYIVRYNSVFHNGVISKLNYVPLDVKTNDEIFDYFGITDAEKEVIYEHLI